MKATVLSFFIGFLLISCVTLKPQPPEVNTPFHPMQKLPVSTISVPVKIGVKQFEERINNHIPNDLYTQTGMKVGNGISMQLEVKRCGDIFLFSDEGKLWVNVPIQIKGKVEWNEERTEKEKIGPIKVSWKVLTIKRQKDFDDKVVVKIQIELGVDENGHLKVETDSVFHLDRHTTLEILNKRINYASIAMDKIKKQLFPINALIDEQLKTMNNINGLPDKFCKVLKTPLLLSDKPINVWVAFDIQNYYPTPIRSIDSQTVALDLCMHTNIKSHVGITPPDVAVVDKIPLKYESSTNNVFAVSLPVFVSRNDFDNKIKERLEHTSYVIPGSKNKIIIKTINLDIKGELFIFKINISCKNLKGDLYLLGKLAYQPQTKMLYAENLDYDMNTDQLLRDKAAFLLNDTLLSSIRSKISYDVSREMDNAKQQTEQALGNIKIDESFRVIGKVNTMSVESINREADFIKINAVLSGSFESE
ncbi:MAG: DUF4403 family protein [Bacteroidales bacterium]|nr:DUF4403 family protein [Bacteroidales bacterium]OQA88139.1 MAG: hypothetical protein BWY27_00963 [Bacteroidetes bacterium ADurb.Bin234]